MGYDPIEIRTGQMTEEEYAARHGYTIGADDDDGGGRGGGGGAGPTQEEYEAYLHQLAGLGTYGEFGTYWDTPGGGQQYGLPYLEDDSGYALGLSMEQIYSDPVLNTAWHNVQTYGDEHPLGQQAQAFLSYQALGNPELEGAARSWYDFYTESESRNAGQNLAKRISILRVLLSGGRH
jgi:hypothetical protein